MGASNEAVGAGPRRYVLSGPGIPHCIGPGTELGLQALIRQARQLSARGAGTFLIEAVYGPRNKAEVKSYKGGREV